MNEFLNRKFNVILIAGVVAAIIVLSLAIAALYFFDYGGPDPMLAQNVRNEYSVPVNVIIINSSGQYVPYIVPGEVKWDSGYERLLYNLSNPKEATLAIVEAFAKRDARALDILMTQSTKNYFTRKNMNMTQILEVYRSNFPNLDNPYIFETEPGEDDPAEGMMSVVVKWVSGEMRFELTMQPDGTWKM